jgi:hypothetical protein
MSSRNKPAPHRFHHSKIASNAAPIASKRHVPSSSFATIADKAESNDVELEQGLISLVQSFSVLSHNSTPLAKTEYGSALLGYNFQELIQNCAKKLENQGNLSGSRHQFALMLITLHRRDEAFKAEIQELENAFQAKWTHETALMAINLLIASVGTPYSPNNYMVFLDSLRALSLVLFENANYYASEYGRILAVLKPLCDVRMVVDKEVQRVAFNCIGNMFYKCGAVGQSYLQEVWDLWMRQVAHMQPQVLAQIGLSRCFSALLRGIQFLIPEAHGIHESGLPSLVSMLCKFIFYGTPLGVMPSMEKADRNSNFELPSDDEELTSNGSEYSGSDVYNDHHGAWKVRFHALGCLQALARASPEKFKAFWIHLLPQSRLQPSIVAIVASDPVHQVRSAACRLISSLFDGQRSFLHATLPKPLSPHPQPSSQHKINTHPQTEFAALDLTPPLAPTDDHSAISSIQDSHSHVDPDALGMPPANLIATPSKGKTAFRSSHDPRRVSSPKSFTPLSMQLTNMLQEVHLGFLNAVIAETRQTTIIAIVKSIAILAHESPYDALPSGLLIKFLPPIQKFVLEKASNDHRLLRASISALSAFIGALSTPHELGEIIDVLNGTLIPYLEGLLLNETSHSVKTEIFRFFSALALNHPNAIVPHWDVVFKVVMETIVGEKAQEIDPNARYAAAKIVDDLSKALLHKMGEHSIASSKNVQMDDSNELSATSNLTKTSSSDLNRFTEDLWQTILNSRITELMVTDRFGLVRSSVCNLFSQIPSPIFASLSRKSQVVCITLLLGAIKDDVPAVRAQAARALGIYILNPSLKVDPLFVSDVTLALVSTMKDKNLNVRTKVAWSAANLCDALVTLRESTRSSHPPSSTSISSHQPSENTDVESSSLDDIPRETLTALARGLLSQCKDNDKVRCNAVRAIGNFIRFADAGLFKAPMVELGKETAKKTAPSFKRPGPSSQRAPSNSNIIAQIVEVLCHLTHEGSAKVRWNACYALANLFHNPLIIALPHVELIENSVQALIVALNQSTNFKVRINATIALHFFTLSGALSIAPNCATEVLKSIVTNLEQLEAQDSQSESGYDEKYQSSLRTHIQQLATSFLYFSSSLAPYHQLLELLKANFELLQRITNAISDTPQFPITEHLDEHDDSSSSSHTQLKLPTLQDLQIQAQAASKWLNSNPSPHPQEPNH